MCWHESELVPQQNARAPPCFWAPPQLPSSPHLLHELTEQVAWRCFFPSLPCRLTVGLVNASWSCSARVLVSVCRRSRAAACSCVFLPPPVLTVYLSCECLTSCRRLCLLCTSPVRVSLPAAACAYCVPLLCASHFLPPPVLTVYLSCARLTPCCRRVYSPRASPVISCRSL